MATLNHPYFGLLDSDALADEVDVLWERGVDVNGHSVSAQLWAAAEAELDASELDQFAARLQNLAELDQRARAARKNTFPTTTATSPSTAKKWTAATNCPTRPPPLLPP